MLGGGAAFEALEKLLLFFRKNSRAVIGNREDHLGPVRRGRRLAPHREVDLAAAGEFQAIADEVQQDLADPPRVAVQVARHAGRDGGFHRNAALFAVRGRHGEHGIDELVQVERLHLQFDHPRLDLGNVEDVLEQRRQVAGALPEQPELAPALGVEPAGLE
jgi:hypothetical protein